MSLFRTHTHTLVSQQMNRNDVLARLGMNLKEWERELHIMISAPVVDGMED